MAQQQFNQQSLERAIQAGQTDFSECIITSEVTLLSPNLERLCFDKADLGPAFIITGWHSTNGRFSAEGARVKELRFNEVSIFQINLAFMTATYWLQMNISRSKRLLLTRAQLLNGFKFVDTRAHTLDLVGCESTRSFFDEQAFEDIVSDDANLGDRTGQRLGDTPHRHVA